MLIQHLEALLHELVELAATVLFLGEVVADAAADDVVRAGEIVGIVAVLPQDAVTVADTGVKVTVFCAEVSLQRLDELIRLGGGDLVGGMIHHDLIFIFSFVGESDYVTAIGGLVGRHFQTHADRLQRGAAAGIDLGVEGQDGHVRGVTFGNHTLGYVGDKTYGGAGGEGIHTGLDGGLHGGAVTQGFDGAVGHTVGNENKVFHYGNLLLMIESDYYNTFFRKPQHFCDIIHENFIKNPSNGTCEAARNMVYW